ncbi:DUF1140 family protein [Staphylococcus simiae]|uniref:Uncharacterized protein n=1 Tax=Staphylococcus simiae CCM 7213 = CCUG 51256 TaxID=911238 RepID=G5JH68_9STAP|nr:DUF1140 family protein [Staphylococcus simiae]EHJ08416.1 hypothetical protein SS7213T_03985 [Staphylococcus simiae CCM 7213 = CCUG 51256]PNZ12626.1 hypothetical protein CD113_06315 [Staphylococcus simiae]SNV67162.1 Protein of uncharacterised function (DUF1140) [Staphylococcus simiae]
MTEKELLLRHSALIVKDLFKSLNTVVNKYYKFSDTSYKSEVGTSQYWKSVAGMEQMQLEIEQLLEQLKAMDEITNWNSKLHQDRYKFVEKYSEILTRYEEWEQW